MNEVWEQAKQFYKDKFGFEPEMVDLVADFYVIRLCASGSSTKNICKFLHIEEDEVYTPVTNCLERHFGFKGWDKDLPFNPLKVYKELEDEPSVENLRIELAGLYNYTDLTSIAKMFDMAETVTELERLLDEKWI